MNIKLAAQAGQGGPVSVACVNLARLRSVWTSAGLPRLCRSVLARASAVPARGFATRSRAAFGHQPLGTMTGARLRSLDWDR